MQQVNLTDSEIVAGKVHLMEDSETWIEPAMIAAGAERDIYIVTRGNTLFNDVYVVPAQNLDDLGFKFEDCITGVLPLAGHAKTHGQIKQYLAGATYALSTRAEPDSNFSRLEMIARFNQDADAWGLYVRPTYELK
jgi:hypothetical protein